MTKKQSTVNEFDVMGKLYDLLKPCDVQARERMFMAVNSKLIAEAPKPRVRKKRGAQAMTEKDFQGLETARLGQDKFHADMVSGKIVVTQ